MQEDSVLMQQGLADNVLGDVAGGAGQAEIDALVADPCMLGVTPTLTVPLGGPSKSRTACFASCIRSMIASARSLGRRTAGVASTPRLWHDSSWVCSSSLSLRICIPSAGCGLEGRIPAQAYARVADVRFRQGGWTAPL